MFLSASKWAPCLKDGNVLRPCQELSTTPTFLRSHPLLVGAVDEVFDICVVEVVQRPALGDYLLALHPGLPQRDDLFFGPEQGPSIFLDWAKLTFQPIPA